MQMILICSKSNRQAEDRLEGGRYALETRGMKVSGSNTKYISVTERETDGMMSIKGVEVVKLIKFK